MVARVELVLRIGQFGERVERVELPISDELARDLLEPVELSDEPLSVMLASPGLYGGKGDAITIRRKSFKLRRAVAKQISQAMEDALVEMFGMNDETDGYTRRREYGLATN